MNTKTQRLVLSSILIGIASVLSILPIVEMPVGGSLTLASMLPIILISYLYGVKWGFISAFSYAILQMLLGFKTVSAFFLPGDYQESWWRAILICLLDYIIAYMVLGFGGYFRKNANASVALCLGSIFTVSLRYLVHVFSGALFFGQYASGFFTDTVGGEFGQLILNSSSGAGLAIIYSFVYNGIYMIPEIILTAIVAYAIGKIKAITYVKI